MAFAGAVAAVVAAVVAFVTSLASAVAVPAAVASAFAVPAAVGYLCSIRLGRAGYLSLVFIGLASVATALVLTEPTETGTRRAVIFAIGALPLLNAVFDYLSYGLTLTLIARGRKRRSVRILWFALFDALCAIAILIALGLTLTAYVALVNALSPAPLFDLAQVFDDLADPEARGAFAWLYVTLFSTLVPTLVHLSVALLSAFTWVPQRYKSWLATQFAPDETSALRPLGGALLGACAGLVYAELVAGGLTALGYAVLTHLESLGLTLLGTIRTLATLLGLMPLA